MLQGQYYTTYTFTFNFDAQEKFLLVVLNVIVVLIYGFCTFAHMTRK